MRLTLRTNTPLPFPSATTPPFCCSCSSSRIVLRACSICSRQCTPPGSEIRGERGVRRPGLSVALRSLDEWRAGPSEDSRGVSPFVLAECAPWSAMLDLAECLRTPCDFPSNRPRPERVVPVTPTMSVGCVWSWPGTSSSSVGTHGPARRATLSRASSLSSTWSMLAISRRPSAAENHPPGLSSDSGAPLRGSGLTSGSFFEPALAGTSCSGFGAVWLSMEATTSLRQESESEVAMSSPSLSRTATAICLRI
mmetsp:Transcript_21073/g.42490  ORF Transcript_21073/g.42490 Transcript_21073/m.42490 type:complete len:252 (-) Transcript_21073:14-769(-)